MSKFTVYEFIAADREMIAAGGGYSFRSYTDKNGALGTPGNEVIYNDGSKDSRGRAIGKAFSINQSHYKLQAREGQKDYDNKSMVDFFLNAPFTEGSPNGDYTDADGAVVLPEDLKDRDKNLMKIKTGEIKQHGVKIKLLETERDAEIALETGLKRAEAQISAGQIDEETLGQIGALIGEFGPTDKLMRHKVYEFAGKRPIDYFKHLNSGDRAIRALIRKGIADKILTQKGPVILWDETVIGADENAAVSTLIADSKILDALSAKVDFKMNKKSKPKKTN